MQFRQTEAHLSINHFQKCLRNDYLDPYDAVKWFNQLCEGMVASSEWIYFDSKTLLVYQILTVWEHLKTDLAEIGLLGRKL